MNEYILAPEAESDLDEIAEYITRDGIDAAVKIVRRIRSAFRLLADNPAMGRMRIDLAARPLHVFPVSSYLIINRPDEKPLQIVRVLSSARDIEAIIG